jgi:hypothetical protein
VTTSTITSNSPIAGAGSPLTADGSVARASERTQLDGRPNSLRRITDFLKDAMLGVLIVFLLPFVILLIGAPIALFLRAVIEIAHRL